MSDTSTLRIGLLSFAHLHAASYARVLSALPGIEVLATDPGHENRPAGEIGGAEAAAEFGVPYVDDIDALLAWQPDGVIVCSENANHRAHVELLVAAGIPVLCEKPLATSTEDARAMVKAAEAAGVALMVAFPVRFSTAFAALRERIEAGALGTICAVTGTNNGRVPTGRAWFTDPELAGGGALTDHTVHVADLMDALLGGQRARSVYAQSNQIMHPQARVETAGLVSIEYPGGVIATIDCSWSKPTDYPTWGGLTLSVVGSAATADMDAFGSRVDGFSGAQRAPVWLPYGADSDAALIAEFVDAIRTGRTPQPDGRVGLRTVEIVEAAYASAAAGEPVALDS
ncbi:Gfo/Idh/MocA family oxidoreductase [Haloactinopolyspora sp.]|uniref:Gfo/Idh/MocA family protein n=1 Tax=Haloactinopolyspora sp. TaxID=1966353 RepID=UPI00261F3640|nr:Gfo/Idh/MocA family oxidoreductase [Haloactinopolyspora sp.]